MSDQVRDARIKVCTEFRKQYDKLSTGLTYDSIGLKYIHGSFPVSCFGTLIKVLWDVFDYKDKDTTVTSSADTIAQMYHIHGDTYSLSLRTVCVGGEINMSKIAEVISRELHRHRVLLESIANFIIGWSVLGCDRHIDGKL